MHQMPADVSRGVVQLSRDLGNQSGDRAEGVGWRRRACPGPFGSARHLPDSPERRGLLSHLPRANVRGGDGPSGHEDVWTAWTFFDPVVTARPLQYGNALYQHISDPPAFSCKQGQP